METKPLFMLVAEERLKGQPERHAKAYKDDISIFEADMMYVRNYLLRRDARSLGEIAKATRIPKSTVQKLLSPLGIKRVYNLEQLESMRDKNIKRYMKVLSEHSAVIKDENGKWKGLEFRESDRRHFEEWLFAQGYVLDLKMENGEAKYIIVKIPPDVKEEIKALYTHRIMRRDV